MTTTLEPTTPQPSQAPTEDTCEHLIVFQHMSCDIDWNLDVILVVDSSSSISETDYRDLKDYLQFVVTNITNSPNNIDNGGKICLTKIFTKFCYYYFILLDNIQKYCWLNGWFYRLFNC